MKSLLIILMLFSFSFGAADFNIGRLLIEKFDTKKVLSKESKESIFKELESSLKMLNNYVPSLSQEQKNWLLKQEGESFVWYRTKYLFLSKEYNIKMFKQNIEEMIILIRLAQYNLITERKNTYVLTDLIYRFMETSQYIKVLDNEYNVFKDIEKKNNYLFMKNNNINHKFNSIAKKISKFINKLD
ncbi:MAG: hypothetical protein ACI81I_000080 [Arcobacteraceae bacterium]|jgi:hypothetical protein